GLLTVLVPWLARRDRHQLDGDLRRVNISAILLVESNWRTDDRLPADVGLPARGRKAVPTDRRRRLDHSGRVLLRGPRWCVGFHDGGRDTMGAGRHTGGCVHDPL